MTDKKQRQAAREVVKLTDLAPRQEIKGGSQRRVFGSDPVHDGGGNQTPGAIGSRRAGGQAPRALRGVPANVKSGKKSI